MTGINRLRQEEVRIAGGRSLTLSTVLLPGGTFESLLFDKATGEEVDIFDGPGDEDLALRMHEMLKERYHVPEPRGKYKKLSDDLKAAMEYGRAHAGTDDGGTCNFDAPCIPAKGWKESLVKNAAREVGIGASTWKLGGEKAFVFSVPDVGQGYTRTRAAEAACDYLKAHGYPAGMYYQMD